MPSIAQVIQHQMIQSSINNKEENMWKEVIMPPSICLEGVRQKQKSTVSWKHDCWEPDRNVQCHKNVQHSNFSFIFFRFVTALSQYTSNDMWGSQSGEHGDFCLLGCDTIYKCFTEACWLHHQGTFIHPDDESGRNLCNIGIFLPDYMLSHPRRSSLQCTDSLQQNIRMSCNRNVSVTCRTVQQTINIIYFH